MPNYILDEHGQPQRVDDLLEWARWFGQADEQRIIGKTEVGDVLVSTVFLGVDHNFGPSGPPVLYETMIFGGPQDGATWRHRTGAEAEAWHQRIVRELLAEAAQAQATAGAKA